MANLKEKENINLLKQEINKLCQSYKEYMFSEINKNQKRTALIYYWLRDYKNYLKNESQFKSKYLPPFTRGNIINVNFGFNLGSELGGMHYAVVLSNSKRNNPTVVVAPMSSLKPNQKQNKSQILLGDLLYQRLKAKFDGIYSNSKVQLNRLLKIDNENIKDEIAHLRTQIKQLIKIKSKLSNLKHGSIINLSQIKTISKMRILDPQSETDILYGISLTNDELDLIDKKIIELFTKSKIDNKA